MIEFIAHIIFGYLPGNLLSGVSLLLIVIMPFIRYFLIALCFCFTLWFIIKRQTKTVFTLSWILLFILGQIPKGHFDTLGAVLSILNANPEQVVQDARALANEYKPMTHFGYPHRYPLNDPLPPDQLPESIRSIHIGGVLILDDYVLIEKHGLQGVFRGFVVFKKGSDLWEHEKSITLQNSCNDCWKIRIIEGLYWYHADPSKGPIYASPLR
jgi:hypothetical protein